MKKAIVATGASCVIIGSLLTALPYIHILETVSQSYSILGVILILVGIGLILYGE